MFYLGEKVYLLKLGCFKFFLLILCQEELLCHFLIRHFITETSIDTFTTAKRKQTKTPKPNPAVCKDVILEGIFCLPQDHGPPLPLHCHPWDHLLLFHEQLLHSWRCAYCFPCVLWPASLEAPRGTYSYLHLTEQKARLEADSPIQ